jgi:hypothetical protein
MIYLNVLDLQLPRPLVAVVLLTGVLIAICACGYYLCRWAKDISNGINRED